MYLTEAGSVIVPALPDMYSREPYWKDIVFFGSVIIKMNIR